MFRNLGRTQSCGDTTHLNQHGQIVVEYLLLVLVAVVAAALITKTMVSNDKDNPGFVLTAWLQVTKVIGADFADDVDAPQK